MELTIISGKGGTGKTMIAVALTDLIGIAVKADCDVDAPNLYLYYPGRDISIESFSASYKAVINSHDCIGCGICDLVCQFGAIKDHRINELICEGCGACILACPKKTIRLMPQKDAYVYLTHTPSGMLSRAEMSVGSDGSGKLITQLRKNARRVMGVDSMVIIDGSPGIGCPVISSVTATDLALLVTEPTLSGLEDFKRVVELCRHFGIQAAACINKYDINTDVTEDIKRYCRDYDTPVVGEIPFDNTVVQSINELRPITAYPESAACAAILTMWKRLSKMIA